MSALRIIGIILLVFLLLGLLRVGVYVSFGGELRVKLRVGLLRRTILPRKPKKKKKKAKKKEKEPEPSADSGTPEKKKRPKPEMGELLELARTALSALGAAARRACRRTRIDPLEVCVTFGGAKDPANAAITYGRASAAMFQLMPLAEKRFRIPDPSLHLRVDFTAEQTKAEGRVGISLRICDLIVIGFTLIMPLLKWYLRFQKAHKQKNAAQEETKAEPVQESKEDKIA